MTFVADESADRQIVTYLRKVDPSVYYVAETDPDTPDEEVR